MTKSVANQQRTHLPISPPDLSARSLRHSVEHVYPLPPDALFTAWTEQFDLWFAAPGTVLMNAEVNAPYFFETHYEGLRHPHYGRFLRLEPDRLVELTWVTGAGGTKGAETVVTVELTPQANGTHLRLTHAGWPGEASMEANHATWPLVLDQLEQRLGTPGPESGTSGGTTFPVQEKGGT